MLFSELLEKKRHPDVFWTGYTDLDVELSKIRQEFADPGPALSPSSQAPQQFTQNTQTNQPTFVDLTPGIPVKSGCEISGPSGSGKTTLWLPLVVDALRQGFNILYVSCNQAKFPLERASKIEGFDSSRHLTKVDEIYLDEFEQLPFLLAKLSSESGKDGFKQYGMVILNRYDILVMPEWSADVQVKAYVTVSQLIEQLACSTCIIATCGVRKKFTLREDNFTLPEPVSSIKTRSSIKSWPDSITPYMIYKNEQNNAVLYSGFQFAAHPSKGVCAPEITGESSPVSQSIFQNRKRTYLRNGLLTPASGSVKRRFSLSTPSKLKRTDFSQSTSSPRKTTSNADEAPMVLPQNDDTTPLPQNIIIPKDTTPPSQATPQGGSIGPQYYDPIDPNAITHLVSDEQQDGPGEVENSQIEYNDSDNVLR